MNQPDERVLFVYYKIDQDQADALRPQVKKFQQQVLAQWPGLSCQLMQRPAASPDGKLTWMEIYRHADALSDQMIDSIAYLADSMGLPSPRLRELFVPLA